MKAVNIGSMMTAERTTVLEYMQKKNLNYTKENGDKYIFVADNVASELASLLFCAGMVIKPVIMTFQDLADYINQSGDKEYVNDVIEYNRWKKGDEKANIVCESEKEVLYIGSDSRAYVHVKDANYSYTLGQVTAIVEKIASENNLPSSFIALVTSDPKSYLLDNIEEWLGADTPYAPMLKECYQELQKQGSYTKNGSTDRFLFLKGYNKKKNDLISGREFIGNLVRNARTERFLTTKKLAEMSGVGPSILSRVENGRMDYGADTIKKICDALDLEIVFVKKEY
jgi:DNA-binding Xre family transcriptional regulator